MTLVLSAGNFFSSLLALCAVKLGRKPGMYVCGLIIALTIGLLNLGIVTESKILPSISLFVYILAFGVGLGSIFGVWMAEFLPPEGVALGLAAQWGGSAVIGYLSPIFLDLVGVEIMLLFFMGVAVLFSVFVMCAIVETKGKTMGEVALSYSK
jgi:hypothetical protein